MHLVNQIDEILDKNGQVSQHTKDTLLLGIIKTVLLQQEEITITLEAMATEKSALAKRVETLEGRNIVTWCLNHPALATLVTALMVFLLFSHYGTALLDFFGIVLP